MLLPLWAIPADEFLRDGSVPFVEAPDERRELGGDEARS